jgi:hypothetical protein
MPGVLRTTKCIFDPSRACGSFVRTKTAYTRKDLLHIAKTCGIHKAASLSMQALCELLREKFFQSQKSSALLTLFYENRLLLPGHTNTFQNLVTKLNAITGSPVDFSDPVAFITLADLVRELFPMPKNFVFVKTENPIFLTVERAADILNTANAVKAVQTVLVNITTWMKLNAEEENYKLLLLALIDSNMPLLPICKMLVRLDVAINVFAAKRLAPVRATIFNLFCPIVAFKNLSAYINDFVRQINAYVLPAMTYPDPVPDLPKVPQSLIRRKTSVDVTPPSPSGSDYDYNAGELLADESKVTPLFSSGEFLANVTDKQLRDFFANF